MEERFILARARGLFSEFPFGTDLTTEEIVLAKALGRLKEKTTGGWPRVKALVAAATSLGTPERSQAVFGAHVVECPENAAGMALAAFARAGIAPIWPECRRRPDCFSTPG